MVWLGLLSCWARDAGCRTTSRFADLPKSGPETVSMRIVRLANKARISNTSVNRLTWRSETRMSSENSSLSAGQQEKGTRLESVTTETFWLIAISHTIAKLATA